MVLAAYFFGAPALVTATAVTALVSMLWRLRGGVAGYVMDMTAGVFTIVYVPFLGGFVALLLREDDGALAIVTFILVTIASDIGGYAVGVLFGRHPMAPVISPKKSWEGFAGSAVSCVVVGWLTVDLLLEGDWWVGVVLGLTAVVMATLGDLCESVIKRDLGIKDMSQIIPGHGGLMDRLDSLLATAAPTWLLLHYLVLDVIHLVRHGRPLARSRRTAAHLAAGPGRPRGRARPADLGPAAQGRHVVQLPGGQGTGDRRPADGRPGDRGRRPGRAPTRCALVRVGRGVRRGRAVRRRTADDRVVPEWEPVSVTRERVVRAVRALRAAHQGDLVLVGHGTAWTVLVAALTGTAPDLAAWERLAMPDLWVVDDAPE